jgi:predicted aspartyl protease
VAVLGYVYVDAIFYNPVDYAEFVLGRRRFEDVRMASVRALADTRATFPALPEDIVEKLGLPLYGEVKAETAMGRGRLKLASVIVQIEDRTALSYTMTPPRPKERGFEPLGLGC